MITEQYVTFETAKMLKDAGFKAKLTTRFCYEGSGDWCFYDSGLGRDDYNDFNDTIACPTQALAARWLRETHHIFIMLTPVIKGWLYDLFDLKKHQYILCNEESFSEQYEEAFETALQETLRLIIKNKEDEKDNVQ